MQMLPFFLAELAQESFTMCFAQFVVTFLLHSSGFLCSFCLVFPVLVHCVQPFFLQHLILGAIHFSRGWFSQAAFCVIRWAFQNKLRANFYCALEFPLHIGLMPLYGLRNIC